jgi:hypothetical protein
MPTPFKTKFLPSTTAVSGKLMPSTVSAKVLRERHAKRANKYFFIDPPKLL